VAAENAPRGDPRCAVLLVRGVAPGQCQGHVITTAEPPESAVTQAVSSLAVRWIFPGQLETAVAMAAGASLQRSRRFHEQVIIGAIGVAALAGLSREPGSAFARPAAWDNQRAA
jgi:hypothetical protein